MTVALDTSVAVPLLIRSHHGHASVMRWSCGQEVALSGHALAETYSVLTRLPGDARLAPAGAARLLKTRFAAPFILSTSLARKMPDTLSRLGLAGGAVYDALVALAAKEHGASLATRDARAWHIRRHWRHDDYRHLIAASGHRRGTGASLGEARPRKT